MRRASTAVAAAAVLVLAACGGAEDDEGAADPTPPPSPTAGPEPEDPDEPDGAEEPDAADETDDAGDEGPTDEPTPDDDAEQELEPVAGTWTTGTSTEENEGTRLVVTDLRVGGHDGFDRVTFEIEGEGAPGWRITYDDDPRSAGSGHEVDIAGDAVLHLSLTSFALPTDAPAEPRDGPSRIEPDGTTAVIEVLDDSIYEGHHDFWLGLDDERPYRVAVLDDPTRLVVDVRTD